MRPAARFLARAAALALLIAAPAVAQFGNEIAYQAQLRNNGAPVTTACDFQFSLWTADIGGGTQVGTTVERLGIPGSDGLFRTTADFGVNPYTTSQPLWLQVAVRNPAGSGSYVPMTPRQRLTASPFSLGTRGLTVNSSGNVGIGTAAPADRMHVAGGRIRVEQENGVGTNSPGVLILSNGTKSNFVFTDSVAAGGHLNIRTDSATNHVILQNGGTQGNVGIGTGSPGSLLSMGTSLDTTKPKLSLWESGTDRWGFGMQASTMTFWTGGTVKAALDSDGDFGIGTLTPMNPLEVVRSTNPSIAITQSGGGRCEIAIAAGTGNWSTSAAANDVVIRSTPAGAAIHLLSGSGTSALTVRGDNDVIVNTDLFVSGFTQLGSAILSGNITVTGNICGNSCWFSDVRLKKEVVPVNDALCTLMKLRGVSFFWDRDQFPDKSLSERRQYGFIAQEVQSVIPEAITESDDGYLMISHDKMIPFVVEAMREQQKQIDDLKSESSKLRDSLAARDAKVEELVRALAARDARLDRIEAYIKAQANLADPVPAPQSAVAAK